jgi:hypothetical protein
MTHAVGASIMTGHRERRFKKITVSTRPVACADGAPRNQISVR